jgi:hypothetical protein
MAKRSFEEQVAKIEALGSVSPEQAVDALRAGLKHTNNYLAA